MCGGCLSTVGVGHFPLHSFVGVFSFVSGCFLELPFRVLGGVCLQLRMRGFEDVFCCLWGHSVYRALTHISPCACVYVCVCVCLRSQGEALLNGYEALAPVKVRRVSRKNTIKVLHQYVHQLQEHEASTTLEEIIVGEFQPPPLFFRWRDCCSLVWQWCFLKGKGE